MPHPCLRFQFFKLQELDLAGLGFIRHDGAPITEYSTTSRFLISYHSIFIHIPFHGFSQFVWDVLFLEEGLPLRPLPP